MSRPTADEAAPDDSHWKPASGAKLPVVVRLSSDASWLLLPNADARLIGPEPSLSDMITFTSGRGSEHARNVECPAAVQDQVPVTRQSATGQMKAVSAKIDCVTSAGARSLAVLFRLGGIGGRRLEACAHGRIY